MLEISSSEQIKAYFDDKERASQSTLKSYKTGRIGFLAAQKKWDTEDGSVQPDYIRIGSAVDCILTGNKGDFDKDYIILDMEKMPSDNEVAVINEAVDNVKDVALMSQEALKTITFEKDEFADLIYNAARKLSYRANIKKKESLVGTYFKKSVACNAYLEYKLLGQGKTILSKAEAEKVHNTAEMLRSHELTRRYFDRKKTGAMKNVEFHFQKVIYFDWIDGTKCKALLDLLIINKDPKGNIKGFKIVDLKTMAQPVEDFNMNFYKLGYDIQASFYTEAVKWMFKKRGVNLSRVVHKAFTFVVGSVNSNLEPMVFTVTPKVLEIAKNGRKKVLLSDICATTKFEDRVLSERKLGIVDFLVDYNFYKIHGHSRDRLKSHAFKGVVNIHETGIAKGDTNTVSGRG